MGTLPVMTAKSVGKTDACHGELIFRHITQHCGMGVEKSQADHPVPALREITIRAVPQCHL
jgi:hypothetical protein